MQGLSVLTPARLLFDLIELLVNITRRSTNHSSETKIFNSSIIVLQDSYTLQYKIQERALTRED